MARQTPQAHRPHSLYETINRSLSSGPRELALPHGPALPLPPAIVRGGGAETVDLLRCDQNLTLARKEAATSQDIAAEARSRQREARQMASAVDAVCERERVGILSLLADMMGTLEALRREYASRGLIRFCRRSLEPGYEDLFLVSSGHVYIGRARDQQPSGYGLYIFPTGAYYEGQWHDGRRSGYGRSMSRNS
ncbi:MAG TPA: hypothetical protein VEB64_11885, partial [Azospirillaceae bacterium]|nr:hypothetical protein [Azospirillaceae bacterium]